MSHVNNNNNNNQQIKTNDNYWCEQVLTEKKKHLADNGFRNGRHKENIINKKWIMKDKSAYAWRKKQCVGKN